MAVHGRLGIHLNLTFPAICYVSGVMKQNVYSSAVFARGSTSLHSNSTWIGSSPINHSWYQKTKDSRRLPDDEDRILLHCPVLTQYWSVTDTQTDRFAVAYTALAKLALL